MKFDKKPNMKDFSNYSLILSTGFSVVVTILLGGLIGYGLDKLFDTDFIIIIGIILFTIIAIVNFFRTLMRIK